MMQYLQQSMGYPRMEGKGWWKSYPRIQMYTWDQESTNWFLEYSVHTAIRGLSKDGWQILAEYNVLMAVHGLSKDEGQRLVEKLS